jgi:excisionase family DNA binding protein
VETSTAEFQEEQTVSSEPILLTVPDVQALTKLGRTKVFELIRTGQLPIVRIGRAVRIRRDALERWLADLEEADRLSPRLPR